MYVCMYNTLCTCVHGGTNKYSLVGSKIQIPLFYWRAIIVFINAGSLILFLFLTTGIDKVHGNFLKKLTLLD